MKLKLLCTTILLALSQQLFAAPIEVGVIYGGVSTGADAVAQLNDDTYFDFNATSLTAADADTLAELNAYDAIVLGDSGFRDNGFTADMFAALRQYLDNGGGIVTTGWYSYATDPYTGQMKLDADYITPILDTNYTHTGHNAPITVLDSLHPIMNGLGSYAVSAGHSETNTAGVDAGAVELAKIGSQTSIAYQDLNGRSVYLGELYLGGNNYNPGTLRIGQADQVFEQAVAWASTSAVPEPSTYALLGLGLLGLYHFRRKK